MSQLENVKQALNSALQDRDSLQRRIWELEQPPATRNLVSAENAAYGRKVGGYTFNAMPPDDYDGMMMVFAAVRLGDHAHVEIQSGRWLGTGPSHRGTNEGSANVGLAGRIVLRWHEWIAWRDLMDITTPYRIAEVERPTQAMLDRYVTVAPSDEGKEIFT